MSVKTICKLMTVVLSSVIFAGHVYASRFEYPSVPFSQNGQWGMLFDFYHVVIPQYEKTASINYYDAFWAKKDGKWGLRNLLNQEILPFVYDDVCVSNMPEYFVSITPKFFYDNVLAFNDTIFDIEGEYIPTPGRGSVNVDKTYPLLAVCKDGDWGYIDFAGNPVSEFIYDLAYPFATYYKGGSYVKLAVAARNGKYVVLDVFGKELTKKGLDAFPEEKHIVKQLKKWGKAEISAFRVESDRVESIMMSQTTLHPYVNEYTDSIKVVDISSTSPKSQPKNKKRKNQHTMRTKPLYQIKTYAGELIVPDTFDVVYPREGDFVRVSKNGKMGIVQLGHGLVELCTNDSVSPIDEYGRALCEDDGVGMIFAPNGVYLNMLRDVRYIVEQTKETSRDIGEAQARVNIEQLIGVLRFWDFAPLTYMLSNHVDAAIERYNNMYDPVLIAEREAEKARRKARKDSSSDWSLLGELLSDVGSLVSGETGKGMSALGESISEVSGSKSSLSEASDGNSTDYASNSNDIAVRNRISEIDNELKLISEQQAALVVERQSKNTDVRRVGQTAVRNQTGANATRNFSTSRVRNNAERRGNAQRSSRNELSSIDNQIRHFNSRRDELIAERNQLYAMIGSDGGASDRNSAYDDRVAESKDKAKKSQAAANNYRSARKTVDTYQNTLYDLKRDSGGRTISELRSEVRRIQKKAKDTIAEYKRLTGEDLSYDADILNWNP